MGRRVAIIQGHPDPAGGHLCHGLGEAYARGAEAAGHAVKQIEIGQLEFPLLRTQADFETGAPPPAIREAQETLAWAQHWVILFPLWLGDIPALTKGFFEQACRPGFGFRYREGQFPEKLMKGRSARLVVTMGMPALIYRLYYLSHGLRSFNRHVLGTIGVNPIATTLIGGVGALSKDQAGHWLTALEQLGREAR